MEMVDIFIYQGERINIVISNFFFCGSIEQVSVEQNKSFRVARVINAIRNDYSEQAAQKT